MTGAIDPNIEKITPLANFVYDVIGDPDDVRWTGAAHFGQLYLGTFRAMRALYEGREESDSADAVEVDCFMTKTDRLGDSIASSHGIDPFYDQEEAAVVTDSLRRGYIAAYGFALHCGVYGFPEGVEQEVENEN